VIFCHLKSPDCRNALFDKPVKMISFWVYQRFLLWLGLRLGFNFDNDRYVFHAISSAGFGHFVPADIALRLPLRAGWLLL
jgi:hypothetical protein